nr:putative phage tail assembly chaperone [uncultured Mediterranean phage uvMED]
MGKLIDNAVAHFSSKEVRTLRVEEWETTLYSKNLSLEDKARWFARADGDNTDYLVYALIYGVTDADGEPVFDIGDKVKLRKNVDPEVLSRVANFVLQIDNEEEREKN